MIDKSKGIVDPWRTVDPVHPPVRRSEPTSARKDLEDIDLDADLAIPGRYVIRSTHVSFAVVSVLIQSPKDAFGILARCVLAVGTVKMLAAELRNAGIGVRHQGCALNVPPADLAASTLTDGDTEFWFVGQPYNQGMRALARVLRMPAAASVCTKHGITVMTNA